MHLLTVLYHESWVSSCAWTLLMSYFDCLLYFKLKNQENILQDFKVLLVRICLFLELFLGCSKPWLSFGNVLLLKCSLTYLISSWLLSLAQKRGNIPTFCLQMFLSGNSSHLSPAFLWLCWCPSTILQAFFTENKWAARTEIVIVEST